jgi:Glutamyl-tRNAGlu reductase, dimerisation domain
VTRGLMNKFLHMPMQALKAAALEADTVMLEVMREVFHLPAAQEQTQEQTQTQIQKQAPEQTQTQLEEQPTPRPVAETQTADASAEPVTAGEQKGRHS